MLSRRALLQGAAAASVACTPHDAGAASRAIAPQPMSYAQAWLIESPRRLLFVSGQVPVDDDGHVPAAFGDQCRLVWTRIEAQLQTAGMTLRDILKITTYLADRRDRGENTQIRHAVLGSHAPAITVVIADIFDEAWLLEIEVIAGQ
ncbi:MAG: RidA family protein [Lysobacter sp.]|nr:RidA family protein [Lysobacter sp.]